MIRVISGKFRQKPLQSPPPQLTRPTSQALKETLFNILEHRFRVDWSSTTVLDAFAGSGSIGIEAASRGSPVLHFIEHHPRALSTLKANLQSISLSAFIHARSCFDPPISRTPVHWVFLDPPYHQTILEPALQVLKLRGWIQEQTLITIECSRFQTPPPLLILNCERVARDKILYFGHLSPTSRGF
jgi:16S rRNA (guanine966-N2)-methyltransferase